MKEARCKNCGQLVEPGRNIVCPACHQSLENNIVFSAPSRGRAEGSRTRKAVKRLLVRYAVGFIFLIVFFYMVFPKYIENSKNKMKPSQGTVVTDMPQSTTESETKEERKGDQVGREQKETVEIKPEQTYFVRVRDLSFNKDTMSKLGKHGDSDILTFKIKEYLNGDIWINEKNMVFIPFEKVTIDGVDGWLLLPETHASIATKNFPSAYDEASSIANTLKTQYDSKRNNVYAYFMDRVMSGEELEAIFITEWNEEQLSVQNIKYHYSFEEFKKIQTVDGIVYELSDGKRVTEYMEIPHRLDVDQDASLGITIMQSEIVLDE